VAHKNYKKVKIQVRKAKKIVKKQKKILKKQKIKTKIVQIVHVVKIHSITVIKHVIKLKEAKLKLKISMKPHSIHKIALKKMYRAKKKVN